jgi:hypothetical protein
VCLIIYCAIPHLIGKTGGIEFGDLACDLNHPRGNRALRNPVLLKESVRWRLKKGLDRG